MSLLLVAVSLALPALVSEDVLEPSVQNEVDHAISRAPVEAWTAATNGIPTTLVQPPACPYCGSRPVPLLPNPDWFGTNGLSSTAIALTLVSAQGPDGRWHVGTNDVTVTALRILSAL